MTGYALDHVRLRQLRLAVPLTLHELAEKADISYPSLLRIEKGEQIPRLDTVRRLAEVLQCEASQLLIVTDPVDQSEAV